LLTVIVALEVPLAINLQRRAEDELSSQALVQAQTIAAAVGSHQDPSPALEQDIDLFRDSVAGRIIVVNQRGVLVGDSSGPDFLGQNYSTTTRPEIQRALIDGVPSTRLGRSETLDEEILAAAAPIIVDQNGPQVVGAVRLTVSTRDLRASIRRTILGLATIGLAGVAAGLIIATVLAGSIARPLQRLAGVTQRLGSGDLSARAEREKGAKEFREMAAAFDDMAARLEQLVRAQREFGGNASHQLRTPLTGLKLRLESAIAKAPPELRKDLAAAEHEADRMAEIVSRLLTMARMVETGSSPDADVADVVDGAAARWRERAEAAGTTIRSLGPSVLIKADASDIGQILDNLIDNAIRYAPGELTIEIGREEGFVRLVVEDRGSGIPTDELDRVTERFYRGRGSTPGGSGLGLSVVRELAERWGGRVAVKRGESGGTRIEVLFPFRPEDA
jgi:signal transduction histidine kinase